MEVIKRLIARLLFLPFVLTTAMPSALASEMPWMPPPGSMVMASPAYIPVMIKGLKVHPENPLLFDFILDTGKSGLMIGDPEFNVESQKLIRYFLASLTIKEDDLWVNLSPYEKDRMITEALGQTELGRDMLAQDYILKQVTASMIHPEKKLGKAFWDRVYARAQQELGSTDIPVDVFNKVWIVADKAKVLEQDDAAYVVDAHLQVMLEEDYKALEYQTALTRKTDTASHQELVLVARVIREVIVPEIEKEVNQGENFAPLRQMFYSMILASWYKLAFKNAFLNQVYSNKEKISGVLSDDPVVKEKIYDQYLQAYQQGVFNYVKEDIDLARQQPMLRKYFSGGLAPGLGILQVMDRTGSVTLNESAGMRNGDWAMLSVQVTKTVDMALLGKAPIDLQVEQAAGQLKTSEALWALSHLAGGAKFEGLKISLQAQEEIGRAFGRSLAEIEELMMGNKIWRVVDPRSWYPETRIVKLIQEVIRPKYIQALSDEIGKFIKAVNDNQSLEVMTALDELVNISSQADVFNVLRSSVGSSVLFDVSHIFGTSNMDELAIIFAGFLARIKEDNQVKKIQSEIKLRRLFLRHEERKALLGAVDVELSGLAKAFDWDGYVATLVREISSGALTNVEYLNYYLESSGLLKREQERNYRVVTNAAQAKGMRGVVFNERVALYKKAREAVVEVLEFGVQHSYRYVAESASVVLALDQHHSPDLTDAERLVLFKKAREAVVKVLEFGVQSAYRYVTGNASVVLALNQHNSPDLTDAERLVLFKKAREAAIKVLEELSYHHVAENARVILALNQHNSSDLTDAERLVLFKKAREAVVKVLEYGAQSGYIYVPRAASVVLGLNQYNSPDLTDAERLVLYKKAREAAIKVLGQLGYKYVAETASVVLALNQYNSPDLTDVERLVLYKKAREAVVEVLEYGAQSGYIYVSGTASVVLALNQHNSPDLTDAERLVLFKKAREAAVKILDFGVQSAYEYIAENARVLLGAHSLTVDLVEGSVMTRPEEQGSITNVALPEIAIATPFDIFDEGSSGGTGASGDWAMAVDNAMKGGIDFNAKNLALDVVHDGKKIEMHVDPGVLAEFQQGDLTGVQGIILSVVTVESPWLIPGTGASAMQP